ncbi:MAG: helix-turn-helix transcriptional regulator [Actinobacteria bacterium]|nr:helix-turn-helix transcriptional regulator [Actinomycetota bacterium]
MVSGVKSDKKKNIQDREMFMVEGPGKSFTEPRILFLLSGKDSHGYEIISEIKDVPLPGPAPDTGAVYRKLREMEEDKLISSRWEEQERGPQRRVYKLEAGGKKRLADWITAIETRIETLNEFVATCEKEFH